MPTFRAASLTSSITDHIPVQGRPDYTSGGAAAPPVKGWVHPPRKEWDQPQKKKRVGRSEKKKEGKGEAKKRRKEGVL